MVGTIYPGPRARQVFKSIDVRGRRTTYSRSCTVEPGGWMLVRVPWLPRRKLAEDRSKLTPDERRFVERNMTPAEYRQAHNGGSGESSASTA